MNILFLGYWGVNEGLSQATILPHLRILSANRLVSKIIYISIERRDPSEYNLPDINKLEHIPYRSNQKNRLLNKLFDFLLLPFFLNQKIRTHKIDLVICRSSLAGSLGYLAYKISGAPFIVESYEPHADYMAETHIWSKLGVSYRVQKWLESKQEKHAHFLLPVSQRHRHRLLNDGIPSNRVIVAPCAVDRSKFIFSPEQRIAVRTRLKIDSEATVGIYIGKFGDIYWNQEAFVLFKKAIIHFRNFHLILLTPENQNSVQQKLVENEISLNKTHIDLVPHEEVSSYLSASDFAFSLHKPSKVTYAFSPIKNGEYWANGLPIVSTPDIGDDSDIISSENGGLVISDSGEVNWSAPILHPDSFRSNHFVELAKKYRNLNTIEFAYQNILTLFVESKK